MTDTALPLLVRRSPIAIAVAIMLALLVAVVELPHAAPAMAGTPVVSA